MNFFGEIPPEFAAPFQARFAELRAQAREVLAACKEPMTAAEVAAAIDPELDAYIFSSLLDDSFFLQRIFKNSDGKYRLVTAEEMSAGMNRSGVFETSEFESLCASGDVFFEMRYVCVGGRFYVCEWYRLPHLTDIAGGYRSYGGQSYETLAEAREAMKCRARVALREALKPRQLPQKTLSKRATKQILACLALLSVKAEPGKATPMWDDEQISKSKPKEPTTMSEKKAKQPKEKPAKPDSAKFRLIPFAELPVRHKGGGVGSAFEVLGELVKQKHITAMNKRDVERHKYALDGDAAIRGVAVCLEVDDDTNAKSWDAPRDIRLWQQMTVNVEGLAPSTEKGPKLSEVARRKKEAGKELIADSKTPIVKSLAGPAPHVESVIQLAVEDIEPCPLNPREIYDDARTQELANNIRDGGAGIIHALLVRPAPSWEPGTRYEVIAGHRRLAAATVLELKTVPVVVREISDEQALTIMMSENLQRADLSPIEEARGYRKMLDLHPQSQEALGAKLGKSAQHIGGMLSLLTLPSATVKALHSGVIGVSIGQLIARIPGNKMREAATKQVLTGFGDGPLSKRETQEMIAREFTAELRGVAWDKTDAKLLPETQDEAGLRLAGGACEGCPFNEAGAGKIKVRLCTHLECYREKARRHVDEVKREATQAGHLVVEGKLAEKYLYNDKDGTVKAESGMVKVSEPPHPSAVNGTKQAPTWRKMLEGKGAKLTVVIDAKGNAHELVESRVALAVAKSNGYSDLLDAKAALSTAESQSSGEGRDSAAEDRQNAADEKKRVEEAAKEKAKLEKQTTAAALDELIVEVGIHFAAAAVPNKKVWPALVELALTHAGSESEALVCAHRKLDKADAAKSIRDYATGLLEKGESQRLPGLFVELLLAGLMKHAGVGCKAFAELAKALDVDVGKIKAAVKAEVAEKKNEGKK